MPISERKSYNAASYSRPLIIHTMSRFTGILWDSLALLAGASMPLAFAPFSLYPMAIISPALLLFSLFRPLSTKRAAWRGVLFGIGMFGCGTSWVYVSFSQFGGMPALGAAAVTATFVLIMSSYIGMFAWFLTKYRARAQGLSLWLLMPSLWTVLEALRSWFLSGFPWLSLGYSQIDSPLNGYAPVFGVFGVSWVVMLSAGGLVSLIQKRQQALFAVPVVMALWTAGYALAQIAWTEPSAKPVSVALLQGNIPQEFKWHSDYQIPSMRRYLQLARENRDMQLIVMPETAVPMLHSHADEFIYLLDVEHQFYGVDFVFGIPYDNPCKHEYFNSVMQVGSGTGLAPTFYHKAHLVPFGEYVPFQEWLGDIMRWLDVPMSEFRAGEEKQPNLQAVGQAIGVSICYEDAYGERVRSSLPEARLLVNVSNDAWFGESIAPQQHLEIARMRALEAGRYLLRATNTGISAIIDPKGKVTAQAPQFEVYSLRSTAQAFQGSTPFVQWGNSLIILLAGICAVLGMRFAPKL